MSMLIPKVAVRNLTRSPGLSTLVLFVVALSVALAIFLSALIAGVERRLIDSATDSIAHLTIEAPERDPLALWEQSGASTAPAPAYGGAKVKLLSVRDRIDDWMVWLPELRQIDSQITGVSPVVRGQALVARGAREEAVRVTGIDPELHRQILGFERRVTSGRYKPLNSGEALVGFKLAENFGLRPGDKIRLINTAGASSSFQVIGTFNGGAAELDERTVFISLREAQAMFALGRAISEFQLKLNDSMSANRVRDRLAARVPYRVRTWIEDNGRLINALESQHSSSHMLTFISSVAAACAVASILFMAVVSRRAEIGILKAMGAIRRQILGIYALEGLLLTCLGGLLGCALGSIFILLVASIPARDPSQNGGYDHMFTIMVDPHSLGAAWVGAMLVGLVAAMYPAMGAARVNPIEVIRGQ